MLSTQKESIRCLSSLYIFCAIFVCLVIVYLNRVPPYPAIIVPRTKLIDETNLFNIIEFKYVLNSGRCESNTFATFIVTSYAGDFETRSAIRQAYPTSLLKKYNLQRVFLLALIHKDRNFNHVEQEAIVNEQERFNDLLQGNFIEDYKNLTYKHTMGLKWITEYCSNVRFVVKMDHDMVFNLFALLKFLHQIPRRERILVGYEMYNMHPIRNSASKWFVTYEEYSLDKYPNFLSGWLYITNPHTVKLLYEMTKTVPYFWIDDTYITGIVAEKLQLEMAGLNKYYTTDPSQLKCCIDHPFVRCPYWVGPNGGDSKLVIDFAKHSQFCFESKCSNFTGSHCNKDEEELPVTVFQFH